LKPFEMLVMIKPGLEDDQLAACRGRLEGWLADNGAQMEEVVDLGELPLSYPVKKNKRGRFLLFWFGGPGELPDAMAQRIRVDDDILRHLVTVRHPASLKTIKRSSEERERNNGKRG
jgi:small subunit ribosomal protein S6